MSGGHDGLSLDELLAHIRKVNAFARMDYLSALVGKGAPVVEVLVRERWLCNDDLGWFATVAIRSIGQAGHGELALQALRGGVPCATQRVREHITAAAEILGGTIEMPAPYFGTYVPSYMNRDRVYHVVVDQIHDIGEPFGDLYLSFCGWVFDRGWVEENSGRVDPEHQDRCGNCQHAMERQK